MKKWVKLWATIVAETLLPDFWMRWVRDITKIRYLEEWYRDIVETWEMIDDIMRSGKIYFDHDHRKPLYHYIAMSLVHEASECDATSEKLGCCKKAVAICRRPENLHDLQTEYGIVLMAIFEICASDILKDSNILELAKIFSEAPQSVRKDRTVQYRVLYTILRFYGAIRYVAKIASPLQVYQGAERCLQMNGTIHPYLHLYLCYYGETIVHKMVINLPGGILPHVRTQRQLAMIIRVRWRSLFKATHATENAISDFLRAFYFIICCDTLQRFDSKLFLSPYKLTYDPDFHNVILDFYQGKIRLAISKLWKIVNDQDERGKGSFLQRLSITYLCNAVILYSCIELGYEHYEDPLKHQLSAVPKELFKALVSNIVGSAQVRFVCSRR